MTREKKKRKRTVDEKIANGRYLFFWSDLNKHLLNSTISKIKTEQSEKRKIS